MAADTSSMEVNGNYAATNGQSYDNYDAHAANQSMSAQNDYAGTNASSTSGNANDISKEEVGWYFVEQYYTTLSKSPEKLYVRQTSQMHHSILTPRSFSTPNHHNSFPVLKPRRSPSAWARRQVYRKSCSDHAQCPDLSCRLSAIG